MMLATSLFLLALADQTARGIAEFNAGRYAEARKLLETAPAGPEQRTFLALSRAATGGCALAERDLAAQFEETAARDLQRLAGLALAQCRLAANRFDDAAPVIARLKALFPEDADVLYQSARLHMRAWNDALFQLYRAAPASYRVNQISAEVLETQGRYAEAVAEYRKAIEKNPAAVNLHYRLGRALLMQSHESANLQAALREFEAELKVNPNDAVAEFQIGQILALQQKPAGSIARFERAVALNPEFVEALLALGKARLGEKRHDEAARLLEKAVQLQPANEAAHYNLMLAYRNAGRAADAQREAGEIEKLRRPPEGEFTEFLKKLGEKPPKP